MQGVLNRRECEEKVEKVVDNTHPILVYLISVIKRKPPKGAWLAWDYFISQRYEIA